MPLYTLGPKHPTLAPDAWVAPSASLIGDVRLGSRRQRLVRCSAARRQ